MNLKKEEARFGFQGEIFHVHVNINNSRLMGVIKLQRPALSAYSYFDLTTFMSEEEERMDTWDSSTDPTTPSATSKENLRSHERTK